MLVSSKLNCAGMKARGPANHSHVQWLMAFDGLTRAEGDFRNFNVLLQLLIIVRAVRPA